MFLRSVIILSPEESHKISPLLFHCGVCNPHRFYGLCLLGGIVDLHKSPVTVLFFNTLLWAYPLKMGYVSPAKTISSLSTWTACTWSAFLLCTDFQKHFSIQRKGKNNVFKNISSPFLWRLVKFLCFSTILHIDHSVILKFIFTEVQGNLINMNDMHSSLKFI